ncbi:hypothetical protein [Kingella negevensis]
MKKIATTLITAILLSACASGTSDTSSTGGLSASSLGKSAVQMYV